MSPSHGKRFLIMFAAALLAACATTAPPPEQRDPADPWEPFNRNIYQFNRTLDKAILKPVARGYDWIMPVPVKRGISNFFTNLRSIPTILNLMLQGQFGDSGRAFERFAVNTIFGVAGIFDVASAAGLERYEADFGQTLGQWGWEQSRYLMLPFAGPSTVRDTLGWPVDIYTDLVWRRANAGRYYVPALNLVQTRAGLLSREAALEEAFDEYLFLRDAWLQRRDFLIRGEDAAPDYDSFLDDEDWEDWED